MIIIALTGSLATGKSTVSALLASPPHTLPIIDADLLARQVVAPGTTGYRQVVKYFGPSTPDLLLPDSDSQPAPVPQSRKEIPGDGQTRSKEKANGRPLNRAALGRRVFGSEPQRQHDRKVLNHIIHPLVRRAMLKEVLYYHLVGHWAVVLDIPLLYESGLDLFASVVIMVAVRDPEVQMRRLRERDQGLSAQEARDRVGSQMGVEEKVGRTRRRGKTRGKVVVNDGGREELEREVERVMGEIRGEGRGEWWRWWLWGSPVGCFVVGLWELGRAWGVRRGWKVEGRKGK